MADAYNKFAKQTAGTLVGNWQEERELRDLTGHGRNYPINHVPRHQGDPEYTRNRDGTERRIHGTEHPIDTMNTFNYEYGKSTNPADSLPKIGKREQLLAQKKSELSMQESQMSEYIGKPFVKGGKLQNRWVQLSEEAYNGFKDFAEGPVQDLHLQLQVAEMKIQELKTRAEESKEIYEGLEKEVQEQQTLVTDLQAKYKQGLDQLDLLTQENLRLKRISS